MYENENFVMQCKRNTIDDNNVKQRTLIRNQLMHLSTKKNQKQIETKLLLLLLSHLEYGQQNSNENNEC